MSAVRPLVIPDVALSAPLVTAWPAARTSRPTPATVLQPDTTRAAATRERAMIFFMGVFLGGGLNLGHKREAWPCGCMAKPRSDLLIAPA